VAVPRVGAPLLRRPGQRRRRFYSDAKQSAFTTAAEATVTLAATDKLIYPGSRTVISAANLFPGKIYEAYIYGTITTAATPGNLGVEIYWGSADAATTLLASSAALTLIANQTTIPFLVTARCQIRSLGSAAVVFCYGKLEIGAAVVAAGQAFIPASAPAAVTVDATAAAVRPGRADEAVRVDRRDRHDAAPGLHGAVN
jgi:hypothetical protein